MDWREIYKSRVVSAEEAISHIKDNDRVALGNAAGVPPYLMKTLCDNYKNYHNVEIEQVLSLVDGYPTPEMQGHIKVNTTFVSAGVRPAVNDARADFTPAFFHETPEFFRTYMLPDVAMVLVSKPDKHGYVSLGPAADFTCTIVDHAKTVLAQVNENVPRTFGNIKHVSEIDYFVEYDEPMKEIAPSIIGEKEMKIGRFCASLIKDGDTLQPGIGALPDAVLACMIDKKDIGLHAEMCSDGVLELIERGIVTNAKKNINTGVSVFAFIMGTKRLYDYFDDNPSIRMYPVDYVNDPRVISQHDNMVSINACIQVDLMGQVASESIGLRQFSGVGGQVDFVRGAAMSKGGRSIIVTLSTTANGKISKIVPFLDQGAAVTTSRNDVHYIVTEYGIAELKGKSLRGRARALINIAHPDFRAPLIEEYERRFNEKF